MMIYDRVVKLDSLAPIYLSYSHNPNRAYLDQWVKSSIRTGYVDLSGTQIRLISPIFEYCLDCNEKSSAESSIFGNSRMNFFFPGSHKVLFNHFQYYPGNFSFYLFFFRNGTRQHLCHTYIASLFSPVTLARRRITNSHAPTRTKLLSFIHDSYFREEA